MMGTSKDCNFESRKSKGVTKYMNLWREGFRERKRGSVRLVIVERGREEFVL